MRCRKPYSVVRRCNLCAPFSSRVSLPTLLFVAVVFSLNIFAIFTVFTVGRSESPQQQLPIGALHPHPQQRELSWDGGEADRDGGGEGGVAPKDSEPHSIRLSESDARASFDFALQREAEIAEKNDRRHHQERNNDQPSEEDENIENGSEESEGKRERGRGRGRDYGPGGSMSLYQKLVVENRARENPAERDRLRGALYSLRRRQKWTMPTFVNFTTQQDVKRYVGPVVEGWPPSKNRSMHAYITDEPSRPFFSIVPAKVAAKPNLRLLFAVTSAPGSFLARQGVRTSWGSGAKEGNCSVIFVVGRPKDKGLQVSLVKESQMHGDMLQLDFVDHYNNLTLKTVGLLKYVITTQWKATPKYLFKLDDDSWINIGALWHELSDAERGLADKKPKERRFIMGKTLGIGKKPILPLRVPKAAKGRLSFTKKWWVPHYMFSGSQYPSMVSGSGYLMDYDSARCIFGEVMKLPYFHLEDVFVTGFGRQACGVPIRHSAGFLNEYTLVEDVRRSDVMVHYMPAKAQNKILKVLTYDELQRKYGELVARLNETEELRKVLKEAGGHYAPYTLPPNELFEAAERGDGRGRRRPSRAKPRKGEPLENALLEADELPQPEGD